MLRYLHLQAQRFLTFRYSMTESVKREWWKEENVDITGNETTIQSMY